MVPLQHFLLWSGTWAVQLESREKKKKCIPSFLPGAFLSAVHLRATWTTVQSDRTRRVLVNYRDKNKSLTSATTISILMHALWFPHLLLCYTQRCQSSVSKEFCLCQRRRPRILATCFPATRKFQLARNLNASHDTLNSITGGRRDPETGVRAVPAVRFSLSLFRGVSF